MIAKGKTARCLSRFRSSGHSSIIPAYSNKGWTTQATWIYFLDHVIAPYLNNQPGVLVCDVYQPHITPRVEMWYAEHNIEIIYIPAGLTPTRQPLDVKVNGPLKQIITKMWGDARLNDPLSKPKLEHIIPMFRQAYKVRCVCYVMSCRVVYFHAMSCHIHVHHAFQSSPSLLISSPLHGLMLELLLPLVPPLFMLSVMFVLIPHFGMFWMNVAFPYLFA